MNNDNLFEGVDSYSEEGKKGEVMIMDNARIHHETSVKEVLENYNVLYLPAYSPVLNPIELWFGCLKKHVAKNYYYTRRQLRRGIVTAVKQIEPSFYSNVYKRLLKVCY